jgi:hypothetical protein
MTAEQVIAAAREAGITLSVAGDCLALDHNGDIPVTIVANLKRHKDEILGLLRPDRARLSADGRTPLAEYQRLAAEGAKDRQRMPLLPQAPAVTPTPVPPSWPEPKITKTGYFGADKVPSRYEAEWRKLLAKRPDWAVGWAWEAAICDCRVFFGEWGEELRRLDWRPEDIFDRWHGLSWFLKGKAVTALGVRHAFIEDGRVFEKVNA